VIASKDAKAQRKFLTKNLLLKNPDGEQNHRNKTSLHPSSTQETSRGISYSDSGCDWVGAEADVLS
jgi:hypothetical protein